jgi:hypothetical protein
LALAGMLPCLQAASMRPVRVCEVLRKPAEYDGKPAMVVGRLSARSSGRVLGEEKCSEGGSPALLQLHADRRTGPAPDGSIEVDTAEVRRSIEEMKKSTALRSFPFGSGDYDRWAIVYGRVEIAPAANKAAAGEERSSGGLVVRSDSLVIFLNDQ